MIYFLVNNNYHFLDVVGHSKELDRYDKSLIQIPHTLDIKNKHDSFVSIYTFNTPFKGIKEYFNIGKVKKIEKKIDTELKIQENDILFLYTEYEVLNQYIIKKFKDLGAKVYVIEDGGFPTYLTYSVKNEDTLPMNFSIKLFYLRYILGYKYVEFLYYNNLMFPQIQEKYIDGVLLYFNIDIVRDIEKYLIKKPSKKIKLDVKKAVFLNEKIYEYYCSKVEYTNILDDILKNLSQKFETVYFKFHPREKDENKKWQSDIIRKYTNVFVICESSPVESIIETYNAKYVFSYLSAALLNLNSMGVTPVYIFHLYDLIANEPVFARIKTLLNQMQYRFLENFDMIDEVSFNNKNEVLELQDIIELN